MCVLHKFACEAAQGKEMSFKQNIESLCIIALDALKQFLVGYRSITLHLN
jgi:hypothetical protein